MVRFQEANVLVSKAEPSETVLQAYRDAFHYVDPLDEARKTAFHEACHAVANISLGIRFSSITIMPSGTGSGGVVRGTDATDPTGDAISTLAGAFAAFLMEDIDSLAISISNDVGQVMANIMCIVAKVDNPLSGTAEPDAITTSLSELWIKTCDLMHRPDVLTAVAKLMSELLRAGTLSGEDAAIIVSAALKEQPTADLSAAAHTLREQMELFGDRKLQQYSTRFLDETGKALDPACYRDWFD